MTEIKVPATRRLIGHLADLFDDMRTEYDSGSFDKITVTLEPVSRTVTIECWDMDDQDFKELKADILLDPGVQI
jgi:hypothetical protein